MKIAFLFFFCIVSVASNAAIYGYVDSRGAYHLSAEKLDSRYSLILQGKKFQAGQLASVRNLGALQLGRITGDPRLMHYEPLLRAASDEYSVELALLKAVMTVESGYNPDAVSPKGAIGLMQVMPATAERFGLSGKSRESVKQKLFDPEINIRLGARYLANLFIQFPGRQDLVIAAYNAGEGAVRQNGQTVPPYAETRNYVDLVTQLYEVYRSGSVASGLHAKRNTVPANDAKRVYLTIRTRQKISTATRTENSGSTGVLSTEIQQLKDID